MNITMIPASIFNVPRSKEDLASSNQGMSSLYYDEVASLRNVTDTGNNANNFGNGIITFRFHPGSGTWILFSRSYIRIDCTLEKPGGGMLTEDDNIAPNMGLGSCLFSKQQFDINDKTVSEISEHVAQVDALKTRLRQTGQWMRTTGDNVNMWGSSYDKRQQKVIANGIDYDNLIYPQAVELADATSGIVPRYLDLVTPNQIETIIANNEIRFTDGGGTAIPDLTKYLAIGDTIYINDGAEKVGVINGFTTTVTANDGITITVGVALQATGPANMVNQFRATGRDVNSDASKSRRVKTFSIIYRPPLSIFDVPYAIPGAGKFELKLTPFSNQVYQKNVIESILADKAHSVDGAAGDYRFKIDNMLLYVARCDGPIVEKDEFFLDLTEVRAQVAQITTGSRSQFSLNISPSTNALTVAFQDSAAETNTLYSQSKFKIRNEEELNLTNFYIRYQGRQKPQPDFRPLYDEATNTDRMVEQWARSSLYNGGYYDSSSEKLSEWRDRGIFLHFPWPRTGSARSTRVYVSTEFSALTDTPRLLLFNHFKKVVIMRYENGAMSQILINEV